MSAAVLPCVLGPAARRPGEQLHMSIDIETLGVRVDSVIVQIAVVAFYPERGEIIMAHQHTITRYTQDRHVSVETLKWHEERGGSPDLRAENKDSLVSLETALQMLAMIVQPGDIVWAKSPTFDCMILRHAFEQCGFNGAPWHFRDERCIRTAEDFVKVIGGRLPQFVGTPHVALDDALHQAGVVIAAYRLLDEMAGAQWAAIELRDVDESASDASAIAKTILDRTPDIAVSKPSDGKLITSVIVIRSAYRPIFMRSMVDKALPKFGVVVDSVELFRG